MDAFEMSRSKWFACPKCNAVNNVGHCKKCGIELSYYTQPSVSVCNNCNITYTPDLKFCTKCGKPLELTDLPKPLEHTAFSIIFKFFICVMTLSIYSLALVLLGYLLVDRPLYHSLILSVLIIPLDKYLCKLYDRHRFNKREKNKKKYMAMNTSYSTRNLRTPVVKICPNCSALCDEHDTICEKCGIDFQAFKKEEHSIDNIMVSAEESASPNDISLEETETSDNIAYTKEPEADCIPENIQNDLLLQQCETKSDIKSTNNKQYCALCNITYYGTERFCKQCGTALHILEPSFSKEPAPAVPLQELKSTTTLNDKSEEAKSTTSSESSEDIPLSNDNNQKQVTHSWNIKTIGKFLFFASGFWTMYMAEMPWWIYLLWVICSIPWSPYPLTIYIFSVINICKSIRAISDYTASGGSYYCLGLYYTAAVILFVYSIYKFIYNIISLIRKYKHERIYFQWNGSQNNIMDLCNAEYRLNPRSLKCPHCKALLRNDEIFMSFLYDSQAVNNEIVISDIPVCRCYGCDKYYAHIDVVNSVQTLYYLNRNTKTYFGSITLNYKECVHILAKIIATTTK